jgi:hypothetical protein
MILDHEQDRREEAREQITATEEWALRVAGASWGPDHLSKLYMFARQPVADWVVYGREVCAMVGPC